ncbi:MAG: hypothetical protein K2P85_13155 [Flavobacteriaceae bacterium]|nr:hypothetical protein [Flavobacteriaceae bacterium]
MIKKAIVIVILVLISCKKNVEKSIATSFSSNQKQIISWYNKAYSLKNSDYFKIKDYADSIKKVNTEEPTDFKALAFLCDGIYYHRIGEEQLSFKNFNSALNLLKKTKNDSLLVTAYSGLGNYYKNNGDYPNSLKNLLQSLKLAEKLKDTVKIGGIHANLGQMYLQKDDNVLAKHHLDISCKILQNHKKSGPYLIAIHTMANIYGMGGDYKAALQLDDEGLKISEIIKSNDLKATFLDNKANCFMYSNRLDSAKYYFDACLKLDLFNKNQKQISDSYANLAQLALFSKNSSEVEHYSNLSISIAEKVNYNPGLVKNYKVLIDLYKSQGNYKKALEVSEKYQLVYKKLINEKKEAQIAELNTFYEDEKKEKELLISKAKVSEKEIQIKNKNTQFQILGLVSLALLIISYLIYRQQKLKNQQQEQEFLLKSEIKEIENHNKLQEQRLVISKDLQDSLGAQLTYIISSIDNLKFAKLIENEKVEKQLTKISNYTKSTFIELRDTIWAMKSSEYTFEDMQSRISNFTEKALAEKTNIDFQFIIDDNVKNTKLSLIVGINLYRSIQEVVNNAIKFSEANQIKVTISKGKIAIQIEVQDNGKGFDMENIEFGNGLYNMKKRIEEINGEFKVDSIAGKGTIIYINIDK